MKNPFLFIFLFILLIRSTSAQEKSIHFENGSWEEIKLKARQENKLIFMDCYATWCGPCKMMEQEVYGDSLIGKYMNSKFISIKIQMDSTGKDDETTRKWYRNVKKIQSQYSIEALPTFLFFNSDGEIIHRGMGYKNVSAFFNLAKEASDTTSQYYTKIILFKEGKISLNELPILLTQSNKFGEKEIANKIAEEYKVKYLNIISDSELLSKKNVSFFLSNSNLIDTKDRFFYFCYHHPELVDSSRKRFIQIVVDNVITKDYITKKIWKDEKPIKLEPDWNNIHYAIRRKYGETIADRLILPQKLDFYQSTNNWKKYAALMDKDIIIHPPKRENIDDSWRLNNAAWAIFLGCDDHNILRRALSWSIMSIENVHENCRELHNFYDTKANIIYKIGKTADAIEIEGQAIKLAQSVKSFLVTSYITNKEKMERREPTW